MRHVRSFRLRARTQTRVSIACAGLVLLLSLAWTHGAEAYAYRYCDCNSNADTDPYYARRWSGSSVNFDIHEVPYSDWRSAIAEAAANWNGRSGLRITTSNSGDNDIRVGACHSDIGILGYTNTEATGCYDGFIVACHPSRIEEADITLYEQRRRVRDDGSTYCVDWSWNSFAQDLDVSSGERIIGITAQHEIGHAVGLKHSSSGLARMESSYPGGGWFHAGVPRARTVVPYEDDIRGVQYLYGASGPNHVRFVDVYASSWAHREAADGTSHESFTNTVPITQVGDEVDFFPRNRTNRGGRFKNVQAGDIVDIRISAANRGDQAHPDNTPVRCFLSANTRLEIGYDHEVNCGWYFYPLQPFSHWFANVSFTVPSGLNSGWPYYVFWLLDTGSGDPNNYSYLQHRIKQL